MAANVTENMMAMEWGTASVYILAILLVIFICIASIGNLLVMISILVTRRQCDRGYIFLFNLAAGDFLTAVCVMPLSLVTLLKGDFVFSDDVCEFNGYTTQLFFIASIHTLMYMAVYRYMKLSQPFIPVHIGKISAMIVATWVFALSTSGLSNGLLSQFLHKEYTTQCGPDYPGPGDILGWVNVGIIASACFIIPLVVILCVYIVLFKKANKLFKRLEDPGYSNYSHEAHTEQRHITMTFIMIVVGFIICWTPIFGYLNFASLVDDKSTIPTLINPIVYWFSYMNSALNPLIYGLRTPIFKRLSHLISNGKSTPSNDSHHSSLEHHSSLPALERNLVKSKTKTIATDVDDVSVQLVYPLKKLPDEEITDTNSNS